MTPNASSESQKREDDFTDADGGDFSLADHMERLRLVEVKPKEEELPLISAVLEKTLPGLEQFIPEERHLMLLGKVIYNAIGVGSRDDKVCFGSPPFKLHQVNHLFYSPRLQHARKM